MFLRPIGLSLALLLTTAPAFGRTAPAPSAVAPTEPRETIEGTLSNERTVIAIPSLATSSVQTVAGLRTDTLGRQIADARPAVRELEEVWRGVRHRRLLEHHFRQPHAIRIGAHAQRTVSRPDPPGQVAGVGVVPGQQAVAERLGRHKASATRSSPRTGALL